LQFAVRSDNGLFIVRCEFYVNCVYFVRCEF